MSTSLSFQEKKRKIYFQDGGRSGHLGFPIGTILAIFDLQVTAMLPSCTNVSSQLAFWFRRRSKNRFSRWLSQRPSSTSDRKTFSYFLIYSGLGGDVVDDRQTGESTDDGHIAITIAHFELFVLRSAENCKN